MKISTGIFVDSFNRLRTRLGQLAGLDRQLSQEKTAARIGCSHAAYRKWEKGTIPRGDWMLKILLACPDEGTYNNFFIDIKGRGSKIPSTSRLEVTPAIEERIRQAEKRPNERVVYKYLKPPVVKP